ncbi:MAG: DoxX family protein [Pirellulaceae bacterium]
MNVKTARIVGWVMSALLSAFLILASASGKFLDWEGKADMFDKFGYSMELMTKIGVVEVILAVLILIPRSSFLGGLLLTAYLGGATATHVRVDDPFYMPIATGVFLWFALALRRPEIFSLAIGSSRKAEAVGDE